MAHAYKTAAFTYTAALYLSISSSRTHTFLAPPLLYFKYLSYGDTFTRTSTAVLVALLVQQVFTDLIFDVIGISCNWAANVLLACTDDTTNTSRKCQNDAHKLCTRKVCTTRPRSRCTTALTLVATYCVRWILCTSRQSG